MGLLDTVIVNLQRAAGDVVETPQTVFEESVGALQSGVGGALALASPVAGALGPLAVRGDVGPEGVTNIITVGRPGEPISQITQRGLRDLSTFMGGFWSGGNGQFATRTTVERLEIATGRVTITSRMPGSPHIMNSEINAAKKVFRRSAALQKRLPRKTVKESETTKLKNAAVQAAIRGVGGECCPPSK